MAPLHALERVKGEENAMAVDSHGADMGLKLDLGELAGRGTGHDL
jgi:hypothetical protein